MDNQNPTEDKATEAQQLLDFYIDLMENSKNLLKYYLSEDIVLDWFGETVKGQKQVTDFIKTNVNPMKHIFKEAVPASKIGFRDTHSLKILRPSRRILRSTFLSPPRPSLMFTPIKQPHASTSAKRQIGQLNLDKSGTKNGTSPPSPSKSLPESPNKRQKVTQFDVTDPDVLESENEIANSRVKYLTAEGYVEFHRPSLKKLQKETKWQRSCKIHIAYDCIRDIKDSSFYLIIYEGNSKCRRKLFADFEDPESED
ncbi:uncharacterized protein [Euwallacea fornicatus]|uniref:uncharacterized protein n=1 Tax=Euwallacea fornicatus TaxID=995702 RepID=UPI0033900B85